MDQTLKQRLVGAVVLTALAAIFVPMLFDDPVDETGRKINELKIPELPSHLQAAHSVRLPGKPSDVITIPVKKPLKTVDSGSGESAAFTRWFLQVGVFSQQTNALALRDKLKKQGFFASVTKVMNEKGAMYRVRVGPEMSKEIAEQVKAKLDKLNNIKSFISIDES